MGKQSVSVKEQMLAEFHATKKSFNGYALAAGVMRMSTNSNVKSTPRNTKMDRNAPLTGVNLADLKLDTVHGGKVLTVKFIVEGYVSTAFHSIVEDVFGTIARLSIYNAIPSHIPQSDHLHYCLQTFREGRYFNIAEPFFKVRLDGTTGIRVESVDDIHFLPNNSFGEAKSVVTWKNDGNNHFKLNEIGPALRCYSAGLKRLNTDNILTKLCTNISLCYTNLQQYHKSLLFAIAGVVMDDQSDKAKFRAALALEGLEEHKAAFTFLRKLSEASKKDSATMVRRLVTQCGSSNLSMLSEIELGKVVSSLLVDGEALHPTAPTVAGETKGLPVESISERVLSLKTSADDLFKIKNYEAAIEKYLECLSLFTDSSVECSPVVLLSNMAQCQLRQDEVHSAALSALVAVTLDSSHAKSVYRLCESLLRLELFQQSLNLCVMMLAVPTTAGDKTFTALKIRIETALALSASSSKAHEKFEKSSSVWQGTEKELEQREASKKSPYELTAMSNMLTSLPGLDKMLVGTGMTSLVESRVGDFHLELLKSGKLTASSCDIERCRRYLYEAYEVSRAIPMHEFQFVSAVAPALEISSKDFPQTIATRFGEFSENIINWFSTAQPGDMYFDRKIGPYDGSILQSMSNATNRPEMITWATTHVAVGFVDFGPLFHSIFSGDPSDGPLRWVGYEASAYCVAKTRVVAEMMRIGADVSSVLQVSYSTGWSRKTKSQFREALTSLLTPTAIAGCEPEVSAYFRHWQTHDVSLVAATSKWLETRTNAGSQIPNFKRKIDRVDFGHYYMTGILLDSEVGSVVMFANPHERESIAHNSSFLHSIPGKETLFGNKSKSITDAAVDVLTEKIGIICQYVRAGRIVLDIRYGAVDLTTTERLHEISAMQPWTMSWSNVCDYFHPRDFHKLARRCSGPADTIHYAYSMNWIYAVYGVQLTEHHISASMQDGESGRSACIERMKNIIQASKQGFEEVYKQCGLAKYMHSPPIDNIRNTVGYILANGFYRKYIDAFFEFSVDKKLRFDRANVGVVEFNLPNVLNRTSTNINFTFTYDKDTKFNHHHVHG